jgi:ribosomal protein S18 acetylase RimI-like enzyme
VFSRVIIDAMEFRPAGPQDAPRIAQLHAASWRVAYRGAMSDAYLAGDIDAERAGVWRARFDPPDATQRVVLAETGGVAVGFVCAYLDHDPASGTFVDNLHVAQAHWGTGVGAALMAEAARLCLAQGRVPAVYLWVLESNARARGFYERIGAQIVERGMWHPPDGSALPKLKCLWPDARALLRWTWPPAAGV